MNYRIIKRGWMEYMGYIIYHLKEEDIAKCAELYVEVFNSPPWNDTWTYETAFKRLKEIYNSPNFFGVIYIEQDQIHGAILGNCEQYYNGNHYNLKEMFISKKVQGSGLGTQLIAALEKQISDYDVNTIYLFTSKGNRTSLFYEKNNFNELNSMVVMGKRVI